MKLLDVATVNRGVQIRSYDNFRSRECGVEILLADFCSNPPVETAKIGTDASLPGEFQAASFAVQGFLRSGVLCADPEDQAWFQEAFQNELDYALGWALTVQHATGSDTWTNGTGVQTTAIAGSSDVQIRDSVAVARDQWYASVVSTEDPILHVPTKFAPILKATGVLETTDKTIFGDRVVINSGYSAHPNMFYSGQIRIDLGTMVTDEVRQVRINNETNVADIAAMIVVPPCSIVRIGAYA